MCTLHSQLLMYLFWNCFVSYAKCDLLIPNAFIYKVFLAMLALWHWASRVGQLSIGGIATQLQISMINGTTVPVTGRYNMLIWAIL